MSCRRLQLLFCVCLVIASAHLSSGRRVSYKNYRLYQVQLESQADISKLIALRNECDSLIFLDEKFSVNEKVHIVVAPHKTDEFESVADSSGFKCHVLTEKYKYYMDNDRKQVQLARNDYDWDFESEVDSSGFKCHLLTEDYKYYMDNDHKQVQLAGNDYDWEHYYELNDTYDFLKQLEQDHPQRLHRFKVGKSAEGQDIFGVLVSYKFARKTRSVDKFNNLPNKITNEILTVGGIAALQYIYQSLTQSTVTKERVKPSIFVEAGMHGNDWITSAVATYMINELLTSPDPLMSAMGRHYNWFIVPHANPDGYVYSGTTDPLWSKTRGQHDHCIGVDANRNWDYNWQPQNQSLPKCTNNYRGPDPFSEVETKALSDTINAAKKSIHMYIALHYRERSSTKFSFSYESQLSSDMVQEFNGGYNDTVSDTYPHGGSSVEWAYTKAGIKNSFNFQLGTGWDSLKYLVPGTQVPESYISQIGHNALVSLAGLVMKALPIDGTYALP